MRQHITQIVAVTSLCVVAWVAWSQQDTVLSKIKSVVTGSQPAEPAKPATAQAPSKSQADAMLHLYQAPGDIKPIKKLPISSPWIPIIRQGDWVKVGIRDATGDVGWINLQQWRAARQALLKPQITTVYVNQTFPKDGQPVVNMVVYRDGEPLSEEEARQLHQAMRQHHRTWQRFSRIDDMDAASWHHQVDDIMRWMMRPHQRAWWRYDDFWSW